MVSRIRKFIRALTSREAQQGYVERRYTEEGKIVNRRYKGYNQQVWFPKEKKNG